MSFPKIARALRDESGLRPDQVPRFGPMKYSTLTEVVYKRGFNNYRN